MGMESTKMGGFSIMHGHHGHLCTIEMVPAAGHGVFSELDLVAADAAPVVKSHRR